MRKKDLIVPGERAKGADWEEGQGGGGFDLHTPAYMTLI